MKLFLTGFAVCAVGLSGVANIVDVGINIIKTHTQQLNSQLKEINNY